MNEKEPTKLEKVEKGINALTTIFFALSAVLFAIAGIREVLQFIESYNLHWITDLAISLLVVIPTTHIVTKIVFKLLIARFSEESPNRNFTIRELEADNLK